MIMAYIGMSNMGLQVYVREFELCSRALRFGFTETIWRLLCLTVPFVTPERECAWQLS